MNLVIVKHSEVRLLKYVLCRTTWYIVSVALVTHTTQPLTNYYFHPIYYSVRRAQSPVNLANKNLG